MDKSAQFEHTPEAHGQGTLFDHPGKTVDLGMPGPKLNMGTTKSMSDEGLIATRGADTGGAMVAARHHFQQVAKEGQPAIQVPYQALRNMASSEGDHRRFKSQYETGRSSGYLDEANRGEESHYDDYRDEEDYEWNEKLGDWVDAPGASPEVGVRSKFERREFGHDHDMTAEHRPIYGYMRHPTMDDDGTVQHYGDATAVLKPHMRERATLTYGDSLASGGDSFRRPSRQRDLVSGADPGSVRSDDFGRPSYVEAQYHGQVHVKDIDHIEVPDKDWSGANHAKVLGVPWRMKGSENVGYQPSLFQDDPQSPHAMPGHAKELQQWKGREQNRRIMTGLQHDADTGGKGDGQQIIHEATYGQGAPSNLFKGQQLSRQFTRHASPGFTSEYDIQH